MKNNVVEFPNSNSRNWMITSALNTVDFGPIFKNASGENWGYDTYEFYMDDDGGELEGYLVYEKEEFCRAGIDGDIEVMKEIFITSDGDFIVIYATQESNYCSCCEEAHCRINRIFAKDQSLTPQEFEDVLDFCQLLIEFNQGGN